MNEIKNQNGTNVNNSQVPAVLYEGGLYAVKGTAGCEDTFSVWSSTEYVTGGDDMFTFVTGADRELCFMQENNTREGLYRNCFHGGMRTTIETISGGLEHKSCGNYIWVPDRKFKSPGHMDVLLLTDGQEIRFTDNLKIKEEVNEMDVYGKKGPQKFFLLTGVLCKGHPAMLICQDRVYIWALNENNEIRMVSMTRKIFHKWKVLHGFRVNNKFMVVDGALE